MWTPRMAARRLRADWSKLMKATVRLLRSGWWSGPSGRLVPACSVRLALLLRGDAILPTFTYTPSRGKCRHDDSMARTNPLGVRVRPEIKEALDRAAEDDDRSVSSLVERVLAEWLTAKGYLAKPEGTKPPRKPKGGNQ